MGRVNNKVALVTGGASGVGQQQDWKLAADVCAKHALHCRGSDSGCCGHLQRTKTKTECC
jgi:NAD(P)-dependent dehydrogenase (short-subunit alcohol dehydrogenase family)